MQSPEPIAASAPVSVLILFPAELLAELLFNVNVDAPVLMMMRSWPSAPATNPDIFHAPPGSETITTVPGPLI